MSHNKQSIDKRDRKTNRVEQRVTHQTSTGIGGGFVGAAIGGLLGRRVGGVFGGVVGTIAGALVGRATAVRVNYTIDSMVGAANTVADAVDHNVSNVGDAVKNTIETVKPSVVSIVDAVKDTVESVKPSVVGTVETAKETVEAVKPSILSMLDALKDIVESLKPSVVDAVNDTIKDVGNAFNDTVESVKPSVGDGEKAEKSTVESVNLPVADAVESIPEEVNYIVKDSGNVLEDVVDEAKLGSDRNRILPEEQLVKVQLLKSIPENPPEIKNIQQRQEEFKHESETDKQPKKPRIQLQTENISKISGVIVLGVAFLTWMSVTLGFNPKSKQLVTKLPEYNQTLNLLPKPSEEGTADGWIFIGTVNNASSGSKSLVEGSQSTDSPVVPIVGSIVTVTVKPGVTLRKNRPQEPNFNYQEQNALTILNPKEKLKILKVELVAHHPNTQAPTKVWAEVHRCSRDCN